MIAVGSVPNDFGMPGVAEHCLYLDSLAQAERIQQVARKFLRGHSEARTAAWPRLQVAIVGAGATGVEFAADSPRRPAAGRLPAARLRPRHSLGLRLIEAAPSVLPALPERLQEATARQLQALSVEVHTGEQVREVTAQGIHTRSGAFYPAELIVGPRASRGPPGSRTSTGSRPTGSAGSWSTRP